MPLEPATPPTGLRLRALLVGLPLVVLLSFVTVYSDMVISSMQIGVMALAPAALGMLLVVVGVVRLLRRLTGRSLLSSHDTFVIYVMMMVSVLMTGRGTIEKLIPPLVTANYFATPENNHMSLLGSYLPEWLVAFDPRGAPQQPVAKAYFEGNRPVEWRLWLGPILSWCGLLALVYLTFLCLAVILRRQWADHEKLVFPLTTLPLTVLDERQAGPFLRNRLMWIGFAIPLVVDLVNGLHANIPVVPELKIKIFLNNYLTTKPWNGLPYTPLTLSFAGIGFFYFLSNDMLLSLWFFFVLTRLTDLLAVQLGFQLGNMPRHPPRIYVGYQNIGAYLVLVLYLVRTGWPHFRRLLTAATSRRRLADADEMLPYRVAVWGALLGAAGSVWWCVAAGLAPLFAVAQMGIYLFFIAVIMARGVAEAGLLQTETTFRTIDVLRVFRPQSLFGNRNLVMLGLLDTVLARDLRGLLLGNVLDDQKLAAELRFPQRAMLPPLAIAIVVTFIAGSYFFLTVSHDFGHVTMYPYPKDNAKANLDDAAAAMQQMIRTPGAAAPSLLVGVTACTLLTVLRARLVWWPFHPLGYAVCGAWTLVVFWFSALLAWVIKQIILKAGGMRLYRRLMPFFLGLAFGSFASAFAWTVAVFTCRLHGFALNAPQFGFD